MNQMNTHVRTHTFIPNPFAGTLNSTPHVMKGESWILTESGMCNILEVGWTSGAPCPHTHTLPLIGRPQMGCVYFGRRTCYESRSLALLNMPLIRWRNPKASGMAPISLWRTEKIWDQTTWEVRVCMWETYYQLLTYSFRYILRAIFIYDAGGTYRIELNCGSTHRHLSSNSFM